MVYNIQVFLIIAEPIEAEMKCKQEIFDASVIVELRFGYHCHVRRKGFLVYRESMLTNALIRLRPFLIFIWTSTKSIFLKIYFLQTNTKTAMR